MQSKDRFDEDEGAWRTLLRRWTAPDAPERLEVCLRREFGARKRSAVLRSWAGRAAIVALALSAAFAARMDSGRPSAVASRPLIASGSIAVAQLDLSDYEPVLKMRLTRWQEGGRP